MDLCLAILIVPLACLGFVFLCLKTVEFFIFLQRTFQEINSLKMKLKFLDERYTETRDDYWKLLHEIAALKKVNGGP